MRMLTCALAGSLLVLCASATASEMPAYPDLVAKAKTDGLSVNYTDLRMAYAASGTADLTGAIVDKEVEPMIESAEAGDCDKALVLSDKVLNAAFVNILAHMVRSECFDRKGELANSAREDTIVSGLRDSILGSGDGRTEKSAFVVVSLDEEQFVLSTLGLNQGSGTQAIVRDGGHSYDLIAAADEKGAKSTIFFQVDAITAVEGKANR